MQMSLLGAAFGLSIGLDGLHGARVQGQFLDWHRHLGASENLESGMDFKIVIPCRREMSVLPLKTG